jgi:hypothetical protein
MDVASIEGVAYNELCPRLSGAIYPAGKGSSMGSIYQQYL